jgi:bromodomain-containing protein 8
MSTQLEKAVSQWPHSMPSEDQEPSKLDAKPLSNTYIIDSYPSMGKPTDEGEVSWFSPLYLSSWGPAVKRKASITEGMESSRDKKRMRDQSEPADDDDMGTKRRDVAFKRFQSVVNLIHSQISQHRNGNIFHHPIKRSDAPDYHDIVKRPMDLKTIKARVRDGVISNAIEFQRDVFLMFANAMMYNRPGSDIHQMAEEVGQKCLLPGELLLTTR